MKKFKVYGTVAVSVYKEVWANSEDEAYDKAYDELRYLREYVGNGGYDRLIGVENDGESVAADGEVEYNDIEMLEDDPYHIECPECGDELDIAETASGKKYWWCWDCDKAFDEEGNEIDIDEDEEDDYE